MKRIHNHIIGFLFLIGIFGIYYHWFLNSEIIGGDWPYYLPQLLKNFAFPPLAWAQWRGNGFGGIDVSYSLHIYENFTILFTKVFHIPWVIVYKIFWFGLFLALSVFSIYFLYRVLFPKSVLWQRLLSAVIYTTNTYVLLVASGGQMGYALGYALAPTVLALFIQITILPDSKKIVKNTILTSISLGILILIDIRIAYLILLASAAYYLFVCTIHFHKKNLISSLFFLIPVLIAFLLNLSWVLPLLVFKQNPVSEVAVGYDSLSSLRFFSFADFSHSLALLHPNWPENVFGKIYFLQPEFLLLPLIAFASLLFINKNVKQNSEEFRMTKKSVLFFALLGLMGIFLGKGVNDPFGMIYSFLFQHIPGFVMFRDPTKFYTFTALSYAILIPFSLNCIGKGLLHNKYIVLRKKTQAIYYFLFISIFCLFWTFTIRQAALGQLGGTFQKHSVPQEYYAVASYLDSQPQFFRTLWLPKQSRFSYSSSQHTLIEALPFFNATSSSELIQKMQQSTTQELLQNASVRYVIVPYDSLGEIFLKDRKYNDVEYRNDITALQQIPWLKQISSTKKIILFELADYKDHFSLADKGALSYSMQNAANYTVHVHTDIPNTLIFSENYNSSWVANAGGMSIHPVKTKDGLMSFALPQKGNYALNIVFIQQQYYTAGFIISSLIFVSLLVALVMLK